MGSSQSSTELLECEAAWDMEGRAALSQSGAVLHGSPLPAVGREAF